MNILDLNGASLIFEGLKGTDKIKSILQNKRGPKEACLIEI